MQFYINVHDLYFYTFLLYCDTVAVSRAIVSHVSLSGELEALVRCCCSVGTASSTSLQHCPSGGSEPRVCWVNTELSHLTGEHEPLSGCPFYRVGSVS